ncbi:DUF5590 domain-containing protein [Paenisporosarcina sp. OV554]|uniref:cell wall elongation regulator TseB-like domain-containing protein n=1 Tax=Paenisporosarcina sp. OV554 TaxID=2135694 RepID=UPI000D37B9CD|nr:DUF5590 domain-containing protein [Paenisporosarcina sp. OV554]PUB10302.1 uncharacterized protein YpmB [Paenisporosarcina sp. OV554]
MKRWIIFITVFILSLSLVISLFVIWKAGQPFSKEQDKAEQLVLSEKKLKVVTDSEVYSGSNTYVTVSGNDVKGNGKAVFIPITGKDLAIEEVLLKDGISKKQAIEAVQTEFKVKEILHTKLGWEQDNAVWEITFLNKNDKLNYVYLLFENGKWWKRILNM